MKGKYIMNQIKSPGRSISRIPLWLLLTEHGAKETPGMRMCLGEFYADIYDAQNGFIGYRYFVASCRNQLESRYTKEYEAQTIWQAMRNAESLLKTIVESWEKSTIEEDEDYSR